MAREEAIRSPSPSLWRAFLSVRPNKWLDLTRRLPRHLALLALGEEMGIDREGDVGVGVAELAGDEDDVEPLGNEQAGNDDPGVLDEVASRGLI